MVLRTPIPRLSLAALWIALQLFPRVSAACGACYCETPRGLRPAVDTIELVPLNARFLVELTDFRPDEEARMLAQSDIRWLNLDTEEQVPFDIVETDGSAGQVWLVPTALLAPDSEFTIEVGPQAEQPVFQERFHTGSTADETPPVAARPQVELSNPSAACGAFYGALLSWSAIDDDGGPIAYDPVVELLVTQGSESVVLFADARFLAPGKGVQLAVPIGDESIDCWASSALPFRSPREPITVTPSIFDRAGNRTQLEPIDVSLRRNPGASCPNAEGDCTFAPLRSLTPAVSSG